MLRLAQEPPIRPKINTVEKAWTSLEVGYVTYQDLVQQLSEWLYA